MKGWLQKQKKRQVIVFTHDLVFYRELMFYATRHQVEVKFQNFDAINSTVGIISDQAPWSAMKVNERINTLEEILKEAKKATAASDIKSYRVTFYGFYDKLRSTWERAVEEILFNQVVQRLEKEVKTMSLDGVVVDDEAIETVFKGMEKTSAMIEAHDHASAQGSSLPGVDSLYKDLEELKIFLKAQQKKRKDAEERLKHLKKKAV